MSNTVVRPHVRGDVTVVPQPEPLPHEAVVGGDVRGAAVTVDDVQVGPDIERVAEVICASHATHRSHWEGPSNSCDSCRDRARTLEHFGLLATTPAKSSNYGR